MSGMRVELELEDGSFTTRMLHAGETVAQFNKNVAGSDPHLRQLAANGQLVFSSISKAEQATKSFIGTLRDVSIVVGFASMAFNKVENLAHGTLGSIVKVNAEFERLNLLMRSLSRSTDPIKDATETVGELRDMAQEVPFSFKRLTDAAVKMKAVGIDPMKGALKAMVDGIAAFGGTDETLDRAMLAITQMSGKGVIQMEELRQQLGEAIPRATELMARSMGVTYGQLIKQIGAGTVLAGPALQKLFLELERTFGGAAVEMMQTFSGQVQRTETLFQKLSTRDSMQGFYRAIKSQLTDFNNFLSSDTAGKMSDMVGSGLTTAVNAARMLIDKLIEMRSLIKDVGTVGLYVFGGWLSMKALGGVIAYTQNLRTEWVGITAQWSAAQAQMQRIVVLNAMGIARNPATGRFSNAAGLTAAGFAPAASQFSAAATKVGMVLPALLSGFSLATSLLLPLGLALYATADYFDLFGNKARNAWQELEEFGAASMKQIEAALPLLDQAKKDLRSLEYSRENLDLRLYSDPAAAQADLDRKIAAKRAELAELKSKFQGFERDAGEAEAKSATDAIIKQLDRRGEAISHAYDTQEIDRQKRYTDETDALNKQGKSLFALNEKNQREKIANDEAYYRQQIALIQGYIDDVGRRMHQGLPIVGASSQIAALQVRLKSFYDQLAQSKAITNTVEKAGTGQNLDKLLKKAGDELERLKGQAEDYKAELAGASGEAAKLAYILKEGKYGDPSDPRVAAMIEQLMTAQVEATKLKDLLDGRTKFERDAAELKLKLEDQIFEAQHKNMSDVDKLILKVQSGFYKGVNEKTGMETTVEALNKKLASTDMTIMSVSNSLKDGLFGSNMINAGNGLISLIGRLADAVRGVGTASSGGGFFGLPGAKSYSGGGDYIDALFNAESGGKTNAANPLSSARGLGQFIRSTWMEFIREIHPEFLKMSTSQMMDLRGDAGLMREAAGWLTQKNAGALTGAGFEASNPNLYLAHFLGSNDAIKVLGSSMGTALSSLLSSKTMAANPQLAGKDVAYLIDLVTKRMGNSTPFQGAPAVSPKPVYQGDSMIDVNSLKGASNDVKQLMVVLQELQQKANGLSFDQVKTKALDDMKASIMAASDETDGFSKRVMALKREIGKGTFGPDKNPDSARYKEMIQLAEKWDTIEKRLADNKKARTAADQGSDKMMQDTIALAQRESEALGRITDPLELKSSQALRRAMRDVLDYVDTVKKAYGEDSAEFKKAQDEKEAYINRFRNIEILEKAADIAAGNQELKRGLMTDRQARDSALNQDIAQLQRYLAAFKGTAEERAMVEAAVTEKISLLRAKAAQVGPFAQMMKQWGDVAANWEQTMTGWIDKASGSLADFITTGKADVKGMINSMISDLTRLATNSLISNLLGGGTGGSKGGGGAKSLGGLGKNVGVAHTGGIVGASDLARRFVSVGSFRGAPKFHTGGIIGSDEVPIIAKRREGIFTPAQMRALGMEMKQPRVTMRGGDRLLSEQISRLSGSISRFDGNMLNSARRIRDRGNVGSMPMPVARRSGSFSADQVSRAGGMGGNVTVTQNLTLHAQGGSHEQNAHLASEVAKQIEASTRHVVVHELTKQMRPGGLLRRPS